MCDDYGESCLVRGTYDVGNNGTGSPYTSPEFSNRMTLAAALVYWAIVVLWLAVLGAVCVAYARDPRAFGATRLLLAVVAIDTLRNVIANCYFGLYSGAQYGLFPGAIVGVLGNPNLLII